jgi:hypothetical protein
MEHGVSCVCSALSNRRSLSHGLDDLIPPVLAHRGHLIQSMDVS